MSLQGSGNELSDVAAKDTVATNKAVASGWSNTWNGIGDAINFVRNPPRFNPDGTQALPGAENTLSLEQKQAQDLRQQGANLANFWNNDPFVDAMPHPPKPEDSSLLTPRKVDATDLYGGRRDSIHGQVGNYHYSTADDPYDPDPIMGYDCQVYVERYDETERLRQDGRVRNLILIGSFQEIQLMVSSRTLKFLEMDSRTPFLLDEEWAFPFMLSKGYIDVNLFEQTMGLRAIHHMVRFGRLPRLRITFNTDTRSMDPQGTPRGELNQTVALGGTQNIANLVQMDNKTPFVQGVSGADQARTAWVRNASNPDSALPENLSQTKLSSGALTEGNDRTFYGADRFPNGRIQLIGAKCNDLVLHAAGVGVIKNQWKGEAEGLQIVAFKEIGEYNLKDPNKVGRYDTGTRPINQTLDYLFYEVEKAAHGSGRKYEPLDGDLATAANSRDPHTYYMIEKLAYEQELAQNRERQARAAAKMTSAVQNIAMTGLQSIFGQHR